jgi:hypothetical protein
LGLAARESSNNNWVFVLFLNKNKIVKVLLWVGVDEEGD